MLKHRKTQKGKKKTIAQLKKDLWKVFSLYIRQRDKGVCFTCGKRGFEGSNYHAGHFLKKSMCGIELYFHEDNVHGQCAYCNLFLDGDPYKYGMKLGEKKVKELMDIKKKTKGKTWDRETFEEKIAHYKSLINK